MDAVDGLWLFSGLWPLTACWSFVSAVIRASGQTSSLVGRTSIFTRCWSNMLANVSITIAMIVAGHYKSSQDSYDEYCHCPTRFQPICQLVSDEGLCKLRSATSRTCVVRWTYSNYGDRCFAAETVEQPASWTATGWQLSFNDL